MNRIIELLEKDYERLRILNIVSTLQLPECYVAAGFIRNMVWDSIHRKSTPLNDIDVVFYDNLDTDNLKQKQVNDYLKKEHPSWDWQVKNQAFMHINNGDEPYLSTLDAMSYWPEKETAVGVALDSQGAALLVSAFGVESLLKGQISYNPKRSKDVFEERIQRKSWLKQWPKLQIIM